VENDDPSVLPDTDSVCVRACHGGRRDGRSLRICLLWMVRPGWGRLRRTITRIPAGHPAAVGSGSIPVSSAMMISAPQPGDVVKYQSIDAFSAYAGATRPS